MKKVFFFLAMLLISIPVINAQAQTWVNFEAPAEISAVAISQSSLFVFGQTEYFKTTLPLPVDPNDITWTASDLPTGIAPVSQAGFVNEELFILIGDQLWKKTGADDWHFEFDGVMNFRADGERLFVWFNNTINIYTGNQWIIDGSPENITCLGFEGENILTFNEDRTMYLNGSYWSSFEDFNAIDVSLDNGIYTAVGDVIGGYAAYYTSDINQSFKYIHVLSSGQLSSVAGAGSKQYAAGQLNGKGLIFDVSDMSDYTIFDSPILQIRSNGATIAGIDDYRIHVREGQVTGINPGSIANEVDDQLNIVNPVCNGVWQINAENDAVISIADLLGRVVYTAKVNKGENNFSLNLPRGIYLVGNKKVVVN